MPTAVYDRLSTAAAELVGLIDQLEAAVPHREQRGYREGGAPKGGSRPMAAWNTPVAMVILEIHAGARELETNLRYRAAGVVRSRGGSDSNTLAALDAVLSLAAGAGDGELRDAARRVEGWCWRARLALGQREPWLPLPRLPGRPVARCPFCNFHTLRHKPLQGIIRCVNPACCDAEGARPVGRVEFGAYSDEPLLVWQDDSTGLAGG